MSERPLDVPPGVPPEPRASALGIVVRSGLDGAELLVGLRAARARFMPGHFAFPGGRMEPGDEPERDGAFARCVSREIEEETGLSIPPAAWIDAGERTTPPMFPVRFLSRFFVARCPEGAVLPPHPPQPEEVAALAFVRPASLLADWGAGRVLVPPPVLPILRLVASETEGDAETLAARIRSLNDREDPLPRIEFAPGIWVLPVVTATLPPASHTNVWMPGARRFVIVDPGSDDPREIERLERIVGRRELGGSTRLAIILTHHHRDHVSGAGLLARALGVPVLAHERTIERVAEVLDGADVATIGDGATIDLDGAVLRAVHTPGHAPGHLAFHHLERNVLIAGDLVSGMSTILVGLADGDMDTYMESLARVRDLGVHQVFPAHGPPLPGRAIAQAIAHREQREAAILAALDGRARSLADIAAAAYADTPAAPPFLRALQTRAHLARLARHGRARLVSREEWTRLL